MLVVPGLITVQLLVQNAIAVIFPAWTDTSTGRARGIDAMGQRIMMVTGSAVALVVALLPAVIAAATLGFAYTRSRAAGRSW